MSFRVLFVATMLALVVPAVGVNAQMVFVRGGTQSSAQQSPRETVDSKVGSADIIIDYGAPSVRGRVVFDSLVPYGKVWRTGANKATHFTTSADLTIGGTTIPAGRYTLYTLPGKTEWKLIINKVTEQWGTSYEEDKDLARIPMQVRMLDTPVEKMKIAIKDGRLHVTWDKTDASVEIAEKQ